MTSDTHMVNGLVSARLGYHTVGEAVPRAHLLGEVTEVAGKYAGRADLRKIVARSVWKAGMETAEDLMTSIPVAES